MLREKDEEERLLNISELREFIGKWEDGEPRRPVQRPARPHEPGDPRNRAARKRRQVFLLTMHNAKGLEFPTVIVSGINSAYMPFFLRKERDEIEEERRLFYVASTRASQLLVISTASDRPSFFLQQVGASSYLPVYSFREIIDAIFPAAARRRPPGAARRATATSSSIPSSAAAASWKRSRRAST